MNHLPLKARLTVWYITLFAIIVVVWAFGVVLLEGMAAGATVVASDIDGYRTVARHDQEAVLVPPNEPDALRDALRRV